MKKIMLIIISLILITATTITIIYFNTRDKEQKKEVTDERESKVVEEPKEEVYIDNNPIKIGLYIKGNNGKQLITEHYSTWDVEAIMGVFYAIPTNESIVSGESYGDVWKEYWNKYTNIEKYKIGYNLKFTRNNGEKVDQVILNPDNAYLMYPKLQCYLYDDINLIPGKPYYHVIQSAMTDKTQFTSIKLVGDTETKNITSPIELTVFTYDGKEDFDTVTGKYIGNSYYTILIKQK